MENKRLLYIQLLCIIMLLLGYCIGDRPDSESVMHFDLTHTHTISAVKHGGHGGEQVVSITQEHSKSHHKVRNSKHLSYKVIVPHQNVHYCFQPLLCVKYIFPLTENYYFLFEKEINPPPPKFFA